MSTKAKIIWRTPGSDVEHTIPNSAKITLVDKVGDRVSLFIRKGTIVLDNGEYFYGDIFK